LTSLFGFVCSKQKGKSVVLKGGYTPDGGLRIRVKRPEPSGMETIHLSELERDYSSSQSHL